MNYQNEEEFGHTRHQGPHQPGCGCGHRGQKGPHMRFGPEMFGMPPMFGFAGPGGPPRFGRGPRAGRGDVKLGIVTLLAEQARHGYEIIQELAARSNGLWQPSPGSVYPTLQALEDEELVTSSTVEGKRVYSITDKGLQYLVSNARPVPPWEEIGGDDRSAFFKLRKEAFGFATAVMQVGQAGSQSQIDRALKLLSDSRKAIYRILAEEDEEPPTSQ